MTFLLAQASRFLWRPKRLPWGPKGDAKSPTPEDGRGFTESGQDLAEYALLASLIALVVIGAVTLLGTQLIAAYNNITATLNFGGGS